MRRVLTLAGVALVLSGCCSENRSALAPLPEDGKSLTYARLILRVHAQANLATEAFYVDDWFQLEDAAIALEQTVRYLPKSIDIPDTIKKHVPQNSTELAELARLLRQEARAKDVKGITNRLQTIHAKIREFHIAPK